MKDVSRREFIASVGATAADGPAAGTAHGAAPQWKKGAIVYTDVEPFVGDSFVILDQESGERARLELTEVTAKEEWRSTHDQRDRPANLRDPFTMSLRLKSGSKLQSGSHLIRHSVLGTALLHVSPTCHRQEEYAICFC